jgi:hypothetical protein
MTTRCSSTPDAISGILLAGDAVLNLSQQSLNCVGSTRFLSAAGDSLTVDHSPAHVTWRSDYAHALPGVAAADVDRVVVVSDEESDSATAALSALQQAGISHVHCTLNQDCTADAFMDEEDAEAVAARLRQLGYL